MSEPLMIAFIGALGAVIGSIATTMANIGLSLLTAHREFKKDEPRRRLLRKMLHDERFEWRNLDTLMHVIGSDEATTKRLLLEVDARASEDGKDLWGLIERHPLSDSSQ